MLHVQGLFKATDPSYYYIRQEYLLRIATVCTYYYTIALIFFNYCAQGLILCTLGLLFREYRLLNCILELLDCT